jgi:hypothetical protein
MYVLLLKGRASLLDKFCLLPCHQVLNNDVRQERYISFFHFERGAAAKRTCQGLGQVDAKDSKHTPEALLAHTFVLHVQRQEGIYPALLLEKKNW